MTVWRISNHRTLDGVGGYRASGRWHTRGRPVVYCAPNPATALVEVLVHLEVDVEDPPANFHYLEIDVPDSISREPVSTGDLGPGWRLDLERTRKAGDQWLAAGRTALLIVPSVLVPATWNLLLNPLHPDAAPMFGSHQRPWQSVTLVKATECDS
ncbi:MAG: RES family NAD+ phosphorylase [Bryobacterales bacterium]|nr:RES family NAD+ phosphorylase [Bryobacterales bacterium]